MIQSEPAVRRCEATTVSGARQRAASRWTDGRLFGLITNGAALQGLREVQSSVKSKQWSERCDKARTETTKHTWPSRDSPVV